MREWIKVDNELPRHDKLALLSPQDRLTLMGSLVDAWSYCDRGRTDGLIHQDRWNTIANPLGRRLMLRTGFAEPVPSGYQMHDYLGHQRSRADIEAAVDQRRKAGLRSAESRRLVERLVDDPLPSAGAGITNDPLNESLNESLNGSSTDTEEEEDQGSRSVLQVPEAAAPETDRPTENDDLARVVQAEIHLATGATMDRDSALALARLIVGERHLSDPAAYVRKAMREPGSRWVNGQQAQQPTKQPPPASAIHGRCGQAHPGRQCPLDDPDPDHPRRNPDAAAAAPPIKGWAPGGPPPPPEVAHQGAALAKRLLAERARPQDDPDEQPPF